jgi:hypothetical protein
MSQIIERFEAAVHVLIDDGPIKQRLTNAYVEHLEDLQQVDLPVAGKNSFSQLHQELHSVAAVGSIGCVQNSVRKMSPAEASRHARTVLKLYTELLALQLGPKAQSETAVRTAAQSPPKYLVAGG